MSELYYVANKSLLGLSFFGFLFLPLALRWPEKTKLGRVDRKKLGRLKARSKVYDTERGTTALGQKQRVQRYDTL